VPLVPKKDDYVDQKMRAAFVVKGLSAETMAAVQAGEAEIVGDDPQTQILKEMGGQE
jgi:hypothetical protein